MRGAAGSRSIADARPRPVVVAAVLTAVALGLVVVARLQRPIFPQADFAVLELYTRLAARGQLLVGPYSRFGWHHPGPIYFWLLAPFYFLAGQRTAGLHAGAFFLNLMACASMPWVAWRSGARTLAAFLAAGSLYLAWRTGGAIVSTWNPHVVMFPAMALVVLSAGVAAGRLTWLPAVAVAATFVAQTHVGLAPTAILVATCATLAGLISTRRPGAPQAGQSSSHAGRSIVLAVAVLLVLWSLPLADELTRTPGNLTRLWTFFVLEHRPGQQLGRAYLFWADALSAPLGSSVRMAWGAPAVLSGAFWRAVAPVFAAGALAMAAVWARRAGRQFHEALAGLLLVAGLSALWSITRIEGEVLDHLLLWIAGIGVLVAAVVAGTGLEIAWNRASPRPIAARVAGGAVAAALAGILVLGVLDFSSIPTWPTLRNDTGVRSQTEAVRRYVREHQVHRVLLRIDQAIWGDAAAVILQLARADVPFVVEPSWSWMFGDALTSQGGEDAEITFAGPVRHAQLETRAGNATLVLMMPVFIDAIPFPPRGPAPR